MSGIVHDLAVCQHFVANDPLLAETNIILLLVYFFFGGGGGGVEWVEGDIIVWCS